MNSISGTTPAAPQMRRFRCPNGMRLWNSPLARGDTRFIYKETFEQRCYEKHGVSVADGNVIFDIGAHVGMFTLSLMERYSDLSRRPSGS